MPVTALQHINIRCADIARSRDFYVGLLGLAEGRRPPFASHGFWLYLGSDPVVHLVQKRPDEKKRGPGTGELDHVAFAAQGLQDMRDLLNLHGIEFREAFVARDNVVQLFLQDPDGVQLELNFPAA
jgi:catechol 2,3-dioxygenase-like lactoylglutathione lyase family enzyme